MAAAAVRDCAQCDAYWTRNGGDSTSGSKCVQCENLPTETSLKDEVHSHDVSMESVSRRTDRKHLFPC